MAFECAIHPEDLQLKASLGDVTAIDTALPDNNPYRVACQPRAGDNTSLIEARPHLIWAHDALYQRDCSWAVSATSLQ